MFFHVGLTHDADSYTLMITSLSKLKSCDFMYAFSSEECQRVLDVAEASLRESAHDLRLRAAIVRKARGVGLVPGGPAAVASAPSGHGTFKLKAEALDEVALRAQHALRDAAPPLSLPW